MLTNGIGHIIKLTIHCTPRARSQWGDRCIFHELKSKGNNHKELCRDFRKWKKGLGRRLFLYNFGSFMHASLHSDTR